MTGRVASLWRHPIKSHGREEVAEVMLAEGQTMPWDRTWAVAHEQSPASNTAWANCSAFSRVAKAPALAAITSRLDEAAERLTLAHPDRPDLTFHPDTEGEVFLAWVAPLMPPDRAASARIVRVPGRGMTDSDYPSVTLCNTASHRAVEQRIGRCGRGRSRTGGDGFGHWRIDPDARSLLRTDGAETDLWKGAAHRNPAALLDHGSFRAACAFRIRCRAYPAGLGGR